VRFVGRVPPPADEPAARRPALRAGGSSSSRC